MENTINKVLIGILIVLAGLCIYKACEDNKDKEMPMAKVLIAVMVIDTVSNTIEL